jgi:hypothetical protein
LGDSKARQEWTWLHNRYAEFVDTGEVSTIECDDRATPCRHRELEKQIILGVGEEWSPQVEDLLEVSDRTEVVQEGIDVALVQLGHVRVTEQGILVLKHQGDGKSDLEPTSADLR